MSDSDEPTAMEGLVCPVPLRHDERIVMGHGSGGKMMQDLIARHFLPALDNPVLRIGDDAGVVTIGPADAVGAGAGAGAGANVGPGAGTEDGASTEAGGSIEPGGGTDARGATGGGVRLAISTDSHVVKPLFFPGGDIGRLAVCGTVNDVAMKGATPMYLTAGFVLEEGLPVEVLTRVVASMRSAALEAGVQIVAGDTKVVERGMADGLYINTAGIGPVRPGVEIGGARARAGDVVILSGSLGDHGIAVLAARGELGFETALESDVAPLNHLIARVLDASDQVRTLRDPTRGGLASTLNEIAHQSGVAIVLDERAIPVRPAVRAACEMLGFDPLYIANEGKLVAIVAAEDAERVVAVMRSERYGEDAVVIGQVAAEPPGRVLLRTAFGSTRVVDTLAGEMLPRIC